MTGPRSTLTLETRTFRLREVRDTTVVNSLGQRVEPFKLVVEHRGFDGTSSSPTRSKVVAHGHVVGPGWRSQVSFNIRGYKSLPEPPEWIAAILRGEA